MAKTIIQSQKPFHHSLLVILLSVFQSIACLADGVADIKFIPNLGQWEGDFAAKTPMKAGDIFYLPNKLIWSNLDIDHQV